mmetsp:Transcript_7401/g.19182  ORF Transcript_7401/g.19182 Transcript_7401/m.19182 type:complete len:97 (+) Transcript_7401:50-340(+)
MSTPASNEKVAVCITAVPGTPQLKKNKFNMGVADPVAKLSAFIQRQLIQDEKLPSIFLFLASSFAPSPDSTIGELYQNFGSGSKLSFNYSLTPAWG